MSHEKPDDLCDKLARAIFEFFETRQIRAPESKRQTYDELPARYRRDYLRHANDAILPIVARTVAEGREARAEVERLRAEIGRLRAALEPFAKLSLWPDDIGDYWTSAIKSDEDWDEEENDNARDDFFIKRGDIRAARKALEGGR